MITQLVVALLIATASARHLMLIGDDPRTWSPSKKCATIPLVLQPACTFIFRDFKLEK